MNPDETYMRQALEIATEKGSDPKMSPIGCVIVLDGRAIATARNCVEENHDATAHAEMVAIREAGKSFPNGELRDAVLYSTLQPCGMCTMALVWAKVGRVVFGAGRADVHKMYFEDRHVNTLDFIRDVTTSLLRAACCETNAVHSITGQTTIRPGTNRATFNRPVVGR